MNAEFAEPAFNDRGLELRCENNEVCIYGTEEGLRRLSGLILHLIGRPGPGHLHPEDYELLTKESLIGTLAIFKA